MIQVTLHFETQDDLVAFFTRGATPVAAVAETAKVIEKVTKVEGPKPAKAAKPAATPPASETATAAPQEAHAPSEPAAASPSEPALTLQDVRAKLAALAQAGKPVKDLIASYNVERLTDIAPSLYADVMAKADKL